MHRSAAGRAHGERCPGRIRARAAGRCSTRPNAASTPRDVVTLLSVSAATGEQRRQWSSVDVDVRDVVLAAHGSRDPRAAADTRRLVAAVGAARPDLRVRAAYLDFTDPALGAALHGRFGPTTV